MKYCFLVILVFIGKIFPISGIGENKTILLLHSYNQGLNWTDSLNRAITLKLRSDSSILPDIRVMYMDTKHGDSEQFLKNFSRYFLSKYNNTEFDLLMSTDNAAFNFLMVYRDSLPNKPPVVFCGLNYSDSIPANFTGVLEDLDISSNIRNVLTIHPQYKKLYLIVDRTLTGNLIRRETEQTILGSFPNLKYEFLTDYSFDELKNKVSSLGSGDIVLLMNFNIDRYGYQISYNTLIEQIRSVCKVPIYGTWDFYVGHGIVGGKIARALTHGELAANMALKILNGASAGSIPVIAGPTEFVFDKDELKKFKIPRRKLPDDAVIINTTSSFIRQHLPIVVLTTVVFILLLAVIVFLVKLFTKEKQIRKKEHIFLQELKTKSTELEGALQQAEKSNQLKNAFLSNLSHEIRTPMNAIVGFSDLMISHHKDKKLEEYASIIRTSSGQLLSIINDIIEMAMIETNQVNLHFSTMNINKTIDEVCASFAVTMDPLTPVEIRKNYQLGGDNVNIVTDEVKFRQILSNLISNGLKFTEKGYVEVGYFLSGEVLEFYVKDTGIGIDPQYHDEIFERFRRVENTDLLLYRGLGIGLTLSQSFVKLLGGKIWLDSEPGRGSTFYFTLPYKKAAPDISVQKDQQAPNLNNHVILICEDDENNLFYFKELFNDTNTTVLWAKNGKEAVNICSENMAIELVLMDLKMPEMNGWEATKIIKKIRPDLPVIAQTAHALSLETNQLSKKGFDDYVTKPIKRNELFNKISRFIS